MLLEDKVSLVTGAGRGIGRAIALGLAREGSHVVAADIDRPAAQGTSTTVLEMGRRSLAVRADVGSLADIDSMVRKTVDTFGRIDILVNNAGVTRQLSIMEITEEEWDRILRPNAKGTFFCMQRVARELIAQGGGGRIINMSSLAGKGQKNTSNAAYASSKAAIIAMTQIGAHQLGRHNINVNAICPGITRTPMLEAVMEGRSKGLGVSVEELERQMSEGVPIGRFNEPEDIADMAVFLAGPGSRNITGQALNVDGGILVEH
jgi:NAD(P)-dependent dehydrogenase (short-subunit alcohol dehydrogenase family)